MAAGGKGQMADKINLSDRDYYESLVCVCACVCVCLCVCVLVCVCVLIGWALASAARRLPRRVKAAYLWLTGDTSVGL